MDIKHKAMTIAVDFDGTIVENRYPRVGREIPFAIDTIKLIQSELKHKVILWTVREGKELQEAVEFCKSRNLNFYAINSNHPEPLLKNEPRKIMADLFIDDRNFGGLPDWGQIYNSLKTNQHFNLNLNFDLSINLPKRRERGFLNLILKGI